ncbi:MAG: hypothetical protein ACR2JR_14050 [Rubrobacteraceae bacterium]
MGRERAVAVEERSGETTLYHKDRAVARVVERNHLLSSSPAPGLEMENAADRTLYYALILSHAHDRALGYGRLFDLHDADPDRLAEFLTVREWKPLGDGRAGWEAPLTVRGSGAILEGDIRLLGADGSTRPRTYQAVLNTPEGASCLTLPERRSWVGPMPLRVALLRTVLLAGLDETNAELARGLRKLGMRVLLAQQAGAERQEVSLDLRDQGFPVFEVGGTEDLREALRPYGEVDLEIQGSSSGAAPTPKALAFAEVPAGLLREAGPSVLPLPEASCLEVLLPILDPTGTGVRLEDVETAFDLTLPTTVPFGEKNQHSTDDVTFKAARGLERSLLDALERLDPDLPLRFKAVENPATGRSRALTARQQLGPWTVHLAGAATVRARKSGGGYLQADEYEQLLKASGDVRVLPAPVGAEDSVQTLLDGTYLQNIVFSKLGAIHGYRPAAVVTPLTDEAFQVFFLAPQLSYGVVGRLRAALAVSGLAGEERDDVRRLADAALDIPRLDARIRYSYTNGEGLPPMEERPPLPETWPPDPIASLMEAAGDMEPPSAGADAVEVRESDGGHTLHLGPGEGLDTSGARGRANYLIYFLDYLHRAVTTSGRIVRVYGREGEGIQRLLAARMMAFTPDPDVPGRATAQIRIGPLKGTRYRLGSERVPEGDRQVQVDLFRADDGSDDPRSITLALGSRIGDPIVAMPTTVQPVFGFGNICGDLGVLERRLAYRVVAFNRSPNERALNALENGVPLYEFDETFDEEGNVVVRDEQRQSFERAGLRLSGKLRDLLEEGVIVGETDRGVPIRARVGHILDGLLGSVEHPVTGRSTKASELYKEVLFDEYEAKGILTIYNGSNSPERVAGGRIFIHDAFTTYGIEPVEHYEEWDGPQGSLMCVSCNTTNITGVLLRLTDVPGLSDLKIRVMTHRKANDQYVGEGKQTVNYQGMAFDFHYHHWSDAKLFYDRIKDEGIRRRLNAMFARDHEDRGSAWAISTHATGQAATEFHTGVIHLSGKLEGGPLDAGVLKARLAARASESAQLIEFPGDEVDARALLETLHLRLGIRNLYVQPFTLVQDGDDAAIVFFTPHLYNVKPNNLVAAMNRDGLIPNTLSGVEIGTSIIGEALGLDQQQAGLARYYGSSAANESREGSKA